MDDDLLLLLLTFLHGMPGYAYIYWSDHLCTKNRQTMS